MARKKRRSKRSKEEGLPTWIVTTGVAVVLAVLLWGCACAMYDTADGNRWVYGDPEHPTARLEPGPRTSAGSIEKIEALVAAVPGLRLTVDTGHVATWGEDPVEVLRHADHVQLRQAAKGDPQRHADDGGDVDFAAVLTELDRLDYHGAISIEYFDLADMGWPLDDPVGHCTALAAHVRALMH